MHKPFESFLIQPFPPHPLPTEKEKLLLCTRIVFKGCLFLAVLGLHPARLPLVAASRRYAGGRMLASHSWRLLLLRSTGSGDLGLQ